MARELKGSSVAPDLHRGEPGTFESEYLRKAGRIDALRIDENSSPAVIEYKRAINEDVINQSLYYLEWLLAHKGEFELPV